MKFRKKPLVIDAVRWTGKNEKEIVGLLGESGRNIHWSLNSRTMEIKIHTPDGQMKARPGDWIIQGVKGELYPCKHEIFTASYDDLFCLTYEG